MTLRKEASGPVGLDLEVMIIDEGSILDLLDRDLMLVFLGGPRALGLLVLPPAKVHQLDDDGARVGRDLHEVEALVAGKVPGFFDRHDAELFAVGADQSDRADADLVIDARSSLLAFTVAVPIYGTPPEYCESNRIRPHTTRGVDLAPTSACDSQVP